MKRKTTQAVFLGAAFLLFSGIGDYAADPDRSAVVSRDADQYVAFGDSITWGGGFFGYPPRLEALLAEKYGAGRVWNAGVGGEQTSEGLARIDAVLSGTNSKYLLLMEGTNDASNLLVSIDAADFNLREMCRRAAAAGWTPLLATIPPRSDWVWDMASYRARIYDLNDRIRQAAFDLQIPLVDQFDAFMEYPASLGGYAALLFDGVHPNSLGYQLLAETWFAALKIVKFDPPAPPLQPGLETKLDAAETRKINVVAWQANPLNAMRALKGYVIYRKPAGEADTAFARIGSVAATVFRYEDAFLDVPTRYAYRVTALSSVSDESAPTVTVAETTTFIFPPINPSVRTVPANPVRTAKKLNVVTFERNPLNESALVSGYRVYRKKDGEPDDRFTAIAALGGSTFRVTDPFVPAGVKYVYAVATTFADGRESKKSASVTAR